MHIPVIEGLPVGFLDLSSLDATTHFFLFLALYIPVVIGTDREGSKSPLAGLLQVGVLLAGGILLDLAGFLEPVAAGLAILFFFGSALRGNPSFLIGASAFGLFFGCWTVSTHVLHARALPSLGLVVAGAVAGHLVARSARFALALALGFRIDFASLGPLALRRDRRDLDPGWHAPSSLWFGALAVSSTRGARPRARLAIALGGAAATLAVAAWSGAVAAGWTGAGTLHRTFAMTVAYVCASELLIGLTHGYSYGRPSLGGVLAGLVRGRRGAELIALDAELGVRDAAGIRPRSWPRNVVAAAAERADDSGPGTRVRITRLAPAYEDRGEDERALAEWLRGAEHQPNEHTGLRGLALLGATRTTARTSGNVAAARELFAEACALLSTPGPEASAVEVLLAEVDGEGADVAFARERARTGLEKAPRTGTRAISRAALRAASTGAI
ncbi:MAG: hypothetical protein AAFP86_00685 [Planctomycetota bacterium]